MEELNKNNIQTKTVLLLDNVSNMKRLFVTFFVVCNVLLLYSQNNASSGIVYGIYTPVAGALRASFCQERFVKENISIDLNVGYSTIVGESSASAKAISLGARFYFNSHRNSRRKYWINPYFTQITSRSGGQGGSHILDLYNIGVSCGKRKYFKNEKFFWDIGIGMSYGYGIYRYYNYTYFGVIPDETSHEDIFSFYPKLVINFGVKY